MKKLINHSPKLYFQRSKDKALVKNHIIKSVEKGSGLTIKELKNKYNEECFFFEALKHITTTKKALCKSLDINIDNACRYKRTLEKNGRLVQSKSEIICPYTKHSAHELSTNPKEFKRLQADNSNQLNLF